MIKVIETDERLVAYGGSFFWWKRIWTGRAYRRLTLRQQWAVMAHELGHVNGRHTEMRILCMLLCPFLFFWLCRQQEFWADAYAAKQGYKADLLSLLEKEYDGGRFQPSHAERRENLKKYEYKSDSLT